MMNIGTCLRQLRQTRKQTLAEVSASTNLSTSYLSNIERSKAELTLDALHRLSHHFDVSASHFLEEVSKPNRVNSIQRPSFREFIHRMNGRVDGPMQDVLIHVDSVATQPANTVDDWLKYYYVISAVTAKN